MAHASLRESFTLESDHHTRLMHARDNMKVVEYFPRSELCRQPLSGPPVWNPLLPVLRLLCYVRAVLLLVPADLAPIYGLILDY